MGQGKSITFKSLILPATLLQLLIWYTPKQLINPTPMPGTQAHLRLARHMTHT